MQVRRKRDHAVKGHAEAEEQGDAGQRGRPDPGEIQDEGRAV